MKKDGTGGWRVVACLSGQLHFLGAMVSFQPKLSLRAMSESMSERQGSVLMSMTHVTTREHGNVPGQGSCLRQPGYSGTVPNRPHPSFGAEL